MEPLVPAEVDLRDFGFMPLDVRRLLTSETWIEAADTPKVGHAAMCLWAEAWHQLPAASLPDNDKVLARLAMCDARTWAKLRPKILAGWVKCSDGLLYHPVVAEKALESWKAKLSQRERTRAATEAREAKRRAQQIERDVHRNGERHEQRNVERDVHQGTVKGQGREGIEEQTTATAVVVASEPATAKPATPDCPHAEIVALYHECLPSLRRVRDWTGDRQAFLRSRWREKPERQSLAWWRGFFEYVSGCPLLMGEVPGRDGGAPFSADLEWLVRPTNFRKVIEGKYQRRAA